MENNIFGILSSNALLECAFRPIIELFRQTYARQGVSRMTRMQLLQWCRMYAVDSCCSRVSSACAHGYSSFISSKSEAATKQATLLKAAQCSSLFKVLIILGPLRCPEFTYARRWSIVTPNSLKKCCTEMKGGYQFLKGLHKSSLFAIWDLCNRQNHTG